MDAARDTDTQATVGSWGGWGCQPAAHPAPGAPGTYRWPAAPGACHAPGEWHTYVSSGFIVRTLPTSHEFCHCIPLISLWFLKRCFGVLSQFLSLDLYKRLGVERDHWPGSRETWSVEGETRGEWAVLNSVSISYQIK